jgi:hypothetical protein
VPAGEEVGNVPFRLTVAEKYEFRHSRSVVFLPDRR